ncbi:hypothetical protein [Litchfieldella xinjiangensis]|uniref:hypothetical protein n=1 Tax=Litchfieldella xinjiangensis TaxID=1166948 RepID=UPI0005BB6FEF|nr:hypothetical protein [Halomonas xinjiangensis]
MRAGHTQLHYTCIFLHVSFQAIKRSLAGREQDTSPCWLDSDMLLMLSRELQACCRQAPPQSVLRQRLDTASAQCGLLLALCPGALTGQLCHQHLDAILSPLRDALEQLADSPDVWQRAAQRLKGWRGR